MFRTNDKAISLICLSNPSIFAKLWYKTSHIIYIGRHAQSGSSLLEVQNFIFKLKLNICDEYPLSKIAVCVEISLKALSLIFAM